MGFLSSVGAPLSIYDSLELHLYTLVEKSTAKAKCLAGEHKTIRFLVSVRGRNSTKVPWNLDWTVQVAGAPCNETNFNGFPTEITHGLGL